MTQEQKEFIELCEVVGAFSIPFLFFKAELLFALSLPLSGVELFLVIFWLVYCSFRLAPHIGGLIGMLILYFEE